MWRGLVHGTLLDGLMILLKAVQTEQALSLKSYSAYENVGLQVIHPGKT
jgi:hypothetical protein